MTAAVDASFDVADLEWGPLERFADIAGQHHPALVAGDFMWMGVIGLVDRTRVQLYKHCDTRSYHFPP